MSALQERGMTIDISAQQPIDNNTAHMLTSVYKLPECAIAGNSAHHSGLITEALGTLGVAIDLSRLESMDPVVGIHEQNSFSSVSQSEFHTTYDGLRHNPIVKMTHDNSLAMDFLSRLGPTNRLRNNAGYDAAYELATIRQLLITDHNNLPEKSRTAEKKMVIGYLNEELALLWNPSLPGRLAPDTLASSMAVDLEDPNVFTEQEIDTISTSDRWKMVGARLANEAADIFENILVSKTASHEERLEAMSRMTDMRVRAHSLELMTTAGKQQKEQHALAIHEFTRSHIKYADTAWKSLWGSRHVQTGALFEHVVLSLKRAELLRSDKSKFVRLALPREDEQHRAIRAWGVRGQTGERSKIVNLSRDIIVQDINGNVCQAYQVKAMSEEEYAAGPKRQRSANNADIVYPVGVDMIYADTRSYRRFFVSPKYKKAA